MERDDEAFLEDLERRGFRYFVEQSDERTGIVRGSSMADGSDFPGKDWQNGSVMVTGFGLAAWCVGAERGWMPRDEAKRRVRRTLEWFDEHVPEVHGWCYHWLDMQSGTRDGPIGPISPHGGSEISSVDKAFLLAGALTARGYFADDPEIERLTARMYGRIDFPWMLKPHTLLFSHGWTPEKGFIKDLWDEYSEATILCLLAIGSPRHPVPPQAWDAWQRNATTYDGYRFIGDQPLFTYQYSHAFVDYRGRRDGHGRGIDWFENSRTATRAHRKLCLDLAHQFPSCYEPNLWGITTSDSRHGYVSWGGPPREGPIDGTVVPCAAGGSVMFEPGLCVAALKTMRDRFGERIYGRYGFCDAFHPTGRWTSRFVQGLDCGITFLASENARSGNVWRWFMRAPEIRRAMDLAGFAPA